MSEEIRDTHDWQRSPGGSFQWQIAPHPPQQPPTYLWWVWVVVVLGIVMASVGIVRGVM